MFACSKGSKKMLFAAMQQKMVVCQTIENACLLPSKIKWLCAAKQEKKLVAAKQEKMVGCCEAGKKWLLADKQEKIFAC